MYSHSSSRCVQCDQKRPFCGRCVRLKAHCSGYTDPWLLSLRQQDAHTAELVRKRIEKARRRRAERDRVLVPLIRTMDETTEMSSISKFFADYTSRSGIPFLELLADVYVAGPPPWLSDAMHAAAMASASRQLRQAGLMTRARQAYGEAVKGINGAIQDEALVNEDSVLIAVFVLGLFQVRCVVFVRRFQGSPGRPNLSQTIAAEFAPQQNTGTEPGCHPHARGALALFRHRAERRLATSLDRWLLVLFRQIRVSTSTAWNHHTHR